MDECRELKTSIVDKSVEPWNLGKINKLKNKNTELNINSKRKEFYKKAKTKFKHIERYEIY